MVRIGLPGDGDGLLEQILRTTDDGKLRHRVEIVLMAHLGRRPPKTPPTPAPPGARSSGG